MSASAFAKRLWGDIFYNASSGKFVSKSKKKTGQPRSFVHFILEPLYKIYAQVLGEDAATLAQMLKKIKVRLAREELHSDPKPLLCKVLSQFFGGCNAVTDMLSRHIPSPLDASLTKVHRMYPGEMPSELEAAIASCDPNGPLLINIVKLYSHPDGKQFSAFGRIYSGTILSGQDVKVLGEGYGVSNSEDFVVTTAQSIAIAQGRHRVMLNAVSAGGWVMIDGIDDVIAASCTVVDVDCSPHIPALHPLKFPSLGMVKVSVEPLHPSELPKMIEGLRSVSKSYPILETKVEESGEHVVFGTGELYLDSALHDLRNIYSDVEVKVTDPAVRFCETVTATSTAKCFAQTANKENSLSMIAGPLTQGQHSTSKAVLLGKLLTQNWLASFSGKIITGMFSLHGLFGRLVPMRLV